MKSRKIRTAKQTSTSPVRPTGRASFAAASASIPSPTSARVASSLRARSALDDDSLKDSFSALQGRSNCSDEALEEYKRFLSLKVGALDWYAGLLSPTPEVDAVWHKHILHTMDYMETCAVLGVPDEVRIIHHNPEGGNDERARCSRLRKAEKMYQEVFGEHPSVEEDKEEEEEEKEEEESDESDDSGGRSKTPTKSSKGGVGKVTPPPGDECITIRFKDNEGMGMNFVVRKTTRMEVIFNAYARTRGVDVSSLRFRLDEERIDTNETSNSLELDDGEEIEVMLEQTGC
jgi:small ubiquitin-related modifier